MIFVLLGSKAFLGLAFLLAFFLAFFITLLKKKKITGSTIKAKTTQKDIQKALDEEALKKEFLILFRELYRCFSTGKLSYISSKVSTDLLKSLEQSVNGRDEDNFEHKFNGEPLCIIHDISIDSDNVVSVRTEFRSEQIISVPDVEDITDNVVDFFTFQKSFNQKGDSWKLVQMG